MRTDAIEPSVREALLEVLTDPARVLAEVAAFQDASQSTDRLAPILTALNDVETRQRRLVRLFTEGDLPRDLLEEQRVELSRRRSSLEAERTRIAASLAPSIDYRKISANLPRVLEHIRAWVNSAEGENFTLLLTAVDARVVASSTTVEISGSIPAYEPSIERDLATIEQTSA